MRLEECLRVSPWARRPFPTINGNPFHPWIVCDYVAFRQKSYNPAAFLVMSHDMSRVIATTMSPRELEEHVITYITPDGFIDTYRDWEPYMDPLDPYRDPAFDWARMQSRRAQSQAQLRPVLGDNRPISFGGVTFVEPDFDMPEYWIDFRSRTRLRIPMDIPIGGQWK